MFTLLICGGARGFDSSVISMTTLSSKVVAQCMRSTLYLPHIVVPEDNMVLNFLPPRPPIRKYSRALT